MSLNADEVICRAALACVAADERLSRRLASMAFALVPLPRSCNTL